MPSPHGITDLLGWFQNYLEYNPDFFSRPERPPAYQQDPLDRAAGDLLHDPTPVEYSHLGMHKAVGDMRRRDDAMSVSPLWDEMTGNAARYLLRNPADWPNLGWEPFSDYRQAVGELGIEGLQAVLAEAGLGVLEPGPGDAMRSLGALFGIPLSLQKMIAKRIHPAGIGPDRLPYQQYHGTSRPFARAGEGTDPWAGPEYAHHTTRTGEYASSYADSHRWMPAVIDDATKLDLAHEIGERPMVRMETSLVPPRPTRGSPPLPLRPRNAVEARRIIGTVRQRFGGSDGSILMDPAQHQRIMDRFEAIEAKGETTYEDLRELYHEIWRVANEVGAAADQAGGAVWQNWDVYDEAGSLITDLENAFGFEGYANIDIGGSVPFQHSGVWEGSGEFVTRDMDAVIRAYHPEDAISWLLQQPDLTVGERAEVLQAVEELGLQGLFQHLSGGGQ